MLSVPQAVIRFKQGFGRLIRSCSDRGFVVILDGRILNKSYGRQFLRSLPVKNHIRGSIDMITKKMLEWINSNTTTNTW
jgi:ATP-dependent DNA helicase DinG